jgi:hypothetical protein
MFQGSPLSLTGWLALLAALASFGLAFVAYMLPPVEEGASGGAICPQAVDYSLPSGRAAELCDTLVETQPFTSEDWLVVRMVVPDLPETAAASGHADHDWVCGEIGLPEAGGMETAPARIIVQLMAEPFVRGEPAPGITQSIEAYTVQDDVCIWELL